VRAHRRRADLSETELADRAGLARSVVRRVEAGGNVTIGSLGQVVAVLGPDLQRGLILLMTMPGWYRRAVAACRALDADLLRAFEQLSTLLEDQNAGPRDGE
jgi:antitoxin (DNA-binding transcriptional repressor) of toxin-antitoxin stability system